MLGLLDERPPDLLTRAMTWPPLEDVDIQGGGDDAILTDFDKALGNLDRPHTLITNLCADLIHDLQQLLARPHG